MISTDRSFPYCTLHLNKCKDCEQNIFPNYKNKFPRQKIIMSLLDYEFIIIFSYN